MNRLTTMATDLMTTGRRRTVRKESSLCKMAFVLMALSCPLWISLPHNTHASATNAKAEVSSHRFELRPIGSLLEERAQRRKRSRRNLQRNQTTTKGRHEMFLDIPAKWLHPYVRGVYATLHPPAETTKREEWDDEASFDAYHDFIKYRHLSRYERHLRAALGWDLHPHWSGNYSNTSFYDETYHEASVDRFNSSSKNQRQKPRLLLEKMIVGGRFDQYQAVPLSQGYGTHYVHLWVGSPTPQRQSVIVDTGSHFTGFPVKGCIGCGERHHTDPHFDPGKSESFHPLVCPQECVEIYSCDGSSLSESFGKPMKGPYCRFKQAYTEGSSWVAYQAKDTVYCGGTDLMDAVDPLDVKYSMPFVFGCLLENSGLFVTQLADGIMGMSAHELTITKQLYNAGKLEYNMFALCFRRELGTSKRGVTAGSMTLGGVGSSLDTSPMIFARNVHPYGWFTVYVEAVYVAKSGGSKFLFDTPDSVKNVVKIPIDESFLNVGRGVIVDSGTTDTYINTHVQPAFVKVWKQITGMEYTHGPVYLTQSQLKRLPTLLVQLQAANNPDLQIKKLGSDNPFGSPVIGQAGYLDQNRWSDVILAIPATNYMEYSPTLKVYTSRLFFTESRGGVLGANAMQGHNVLFDWQHGRIGFAQSSCSYDLIAGKTYSQKNSVSSAENYGNDCVLDSDRPILSQTCIESVDIAICEASDHPTNVDISGMEIWTLIVEAPGNPGSCEVAMLDWIESQDTVRQIDPSTTNCTMNGFCQEFRPCHVPCMKALEFHRNRSHSNPDMKRAETVPHAIISNDFNSIPDSLDVANEDSCHSLLWSACDHACRQIKVASYSVQHDAGQYCVELDREFRQCHVDACGRSDPCVVPFLVQAIFVLEGSTEEWSPELEQQFKAEFTLAAKHPLLRSRASDREFLFEEGDINILASRSWYNNDADDELQEFAATETVAAKDEDAATGVEVILQISMYNQKALRQPRLEGSDIIHGRTLLQEVGVIWSNITQVFRGPGPSSMCDPYDLYPIAMDAHEVANNVLSNPIFQATLLKNLAAYQDVRLVSSWTIGTQVYDEYINYLGPLASTPFFMVVKFLHEAFVFMVFAWLVMCVLKACRLFRVCAVRSFKQHRRIHYRPLSTRALDDNDDQSEGQFGPRARGAGQMSPEMELTATHLRSKAIKRRCSTSEN